MKCVSLWIDLKPYINTSNEIWIPSSAKLFNIYMHTHTNDAEILLMGNRREWTCSVSWTNIWKELKYP